MRALATWFVVMGCSTSPPYNFDDDRTPCPALGAICDTPVGAAPAITEPVIVAPSSAMPDGVISQVSHNNLDIVWFRGRLFFAFRTAPTHFASREVVMYIVSTVDQREWQLEATIEMQTDVREPRFLILDDRLFFYFAVLGDYLAEFTPREARVMELLAPGEWSDSEVIFEPGFIPWRTKSIDGRPSLIGYVGGEQIYQPEGRPIEVSWLTTTDGHTFEPATDRAVVLVGGSSETDLVSLDDGSIVAVSRNELGDDSGWGTKVCTAQSSARGEWSCAIDPRKLDSPLMFRHRDEVYVIARRQVAHDGNYDLFLRHLTPAEQAQSYNVEYWVTPKRCALWRVDPTTRSFAHVLDLPSSGDTCFPGLVELGGGRYLVYNYTSPLEGDLDRSWMSAQFGPTQIHQLVLTLP
ncbi:MAG: hypothetical protein ACKV2T_31730 [Kofleriaceae bacterium]